MLFIGFGYVFHFLVSIISHHRGVMDICIGGNPIC